MTTEGRRKLYKPGARVSLSGWEVVSDYMTVPSGTKGTVRRVDDAGTVHVDWENGAKLGVTFDDQIIRIG
jgi:hypothetical protein